MELLSTIFPMLLNNNAKLPFFPLESRILEQKNVLSFLFNKILCLLLNEHPLQSEKRNAGVVFLKHAIDNNKGRL